MIVEFQPYNGNRDFLQASRVWLSTFFDEKESVVCVGKIKLIFSDPPPRFSSFFFFLRKRKPQHNQYRIKSGPVRWEATLKITFSIKVTLFWVETQVLYASLGAKFNGASGKLVVVDRSWQDAHHKGCPGLSLACWSMPKRSFLSGLSSFREQVAAAQSWTLRAELKPNCVWTSRQLCFPSEH